MIQADHRSLRRDDPDRADVITLYLVGKGKGIFIDPIESYHKGIGVFRRRAKSNYLLVDRNKHVTVSFLLEVTADKVEYMEDEETEATATVYQSRRAPKRSASSMEGPPSLVVPPKPRRYVSALPVPKTVAATKEDTFGNGASP
jgi:hypothetical protein